MTSSITVQQSTVPRSLSRERKKNRISESEVSFTSCSLALPVQRQKCVTGPPRSSSIIIEVVLQNAVPNLQNCSPKNLYRECLIEVDFTLVERRFSPLSDAVYRVSIGARSAAGTVTGSKQ